MKHNEHQMLSIISSGGWGGGVLSIIEIGIECVLFFKGLIVVEHYKLSFLERLSSSRRSLKCIILGHPFHLEI